MSHVHGVQVLGCYGRKPDMLGFDVNQLISAAAEGGKMVASEVQKSQDAKKSADESAKRLVDVLAADASATSARATALISDAAAKAAQSMVLTDPNNASLVERAQAAVSAAETDKTISDQASSLQDAAATGLLPPEQAKRTQAAQDAVKTALAESQKAAQALSAAPSDVARKQALQNAKFKVQAAQVTATKASGTQLATQGGKVPTAEEQAKADAILKQGKDKGHLESGSFLTKKAGGLPVYGWGLLGLGAIGASVGGYFLFRKH